MQGDCNCGSCPVHSAPSGCNCDETDRKLGLKVDKDILGKIDFPIEFHLRRVFVETYMDALDDFWNNVAIGNPKKKEWYLVYK